VALRVASSVGSAVAVMALLLVSAALMAAGTYNPFIYFRF
jgi:hypothetical protein